MKKLVAIALLVFLYGCCGGEEARADDWRDKFLKEVDQHYTSVRTLKTKIEELDNDATELRSIVKSQGVEIDRLKRELAAKQ